MTMEKVHGKICSHLMNNLLVVMTLIGVAVGITIGIFVRQTNPSQDLIIWLGLPGDVFLNSLNMVVLPLIVTSVIAGTASMEPRCNGNVSVVALIYIVVTNSLACVMPILMTLATQPGKRNKDIEGIGTSNEGGAVMETSDVFADLLRNLFPPNIISGCFEQFQTKYEYVHTSSDKPSTNDTLLVNNQTDRVTKEKVDGRLRSTNILGLVVCSLLFGVAASVTGNEGHGLFAFCKSANAVTMKVLSWLIRFTPIGAASLIVKAFLETEHLDSIVKSLGHYSLLMAGCLILHVILLAIILHLIVLRSNPLPFFASLGRAYTVAIATASSVMAMPEIFHGLENRLTIDNRVTRFTVPMATAINKDGSSIYIAVSCLFLAQMSGHTLNVADVVILWASLSLVCMATPDVPSGGIAIIIVILSSLGIPTHLVGLLFATEWILDRIQACVNVTSHGYCALVVSYYCIDTLPNNKSTPEVPTHKRTPDVPSQKNTPDVSPTENTPDVPFHNNNSEVSALKRTQGMPIPKNAREVPTHNNTPDVSPFKNTPDVPCHKNIVGVPTLKSSPDVPTHKSTPEVPTHKHNPHTSPLEFIPDIPFHKNTLDLPLFKKTADVPPLRIIPDLSRFFNTEDLSHLRNTPDVASQKHNPDFPPSKITTDLQPQKNTPGEEKNAIREEQSTTVVGGESYV